MNSSLSRSAALGVAVLLFCACPPSSPGGRETAKVQAPLKKSADAVKLEFFVMSQCPYGVQVVNAVKDAVDKLGPDLDFTMDFIGTKGANGELSSMHGPNEVTGDIVQLCAAKVAPASYLAMAVCQNKTVKDVATNWEQCAKEAQLPVEEIRTCLTGPEGKQLLMASFDRATARQARGSPTIFVAGKPYNGRRSPTDFLRAVCAEHKGATKPAACQNIPELPTVNVTLLGDKRCTECNIERYAGMLNSRLGKANIKRLDYTEDEGRKFYDELGGSPNLPLVLFDSSIDADAEGKQSFARQLQPLGKFQSLNVGGSWSPACMNDGGCALPQCKETLACRKEVPNKLEVFVMSQCPFGVKALNAMEEVLKNFNGKVDFSVHYIANGTAASGFTSLHGQGEVDENVRELCAMKSYGKSYKFMDYVLCRNKAITSTNWEGCAANGIDAKAIKKCAEGDEGKKLHEEDIKLANSLGIGSSPTWIANGKFKFSGIDAETVRSNLCQHNKDLKGCENKLTGNTAGPSGGCGCAGGGGGASACGK